MTRSRRNAGFTLLELLLVLVIVAGLALFVLPSLTGSTDKRRVERQARGAVALARKARALASGEGRVYLLVVDRERRELSLARRRDSLAEATNDEDPELDVPVEGAAWPATIAFEDGVELTSVERDGELSDDGEPVRVAFLPVGEAEDVRVVFTGGDSSLAVKIDRYLGVARVEEVAP